MTILRDDYIKWRMRATYGSCWLKFSIPQLVPLTKWDWRWHFWVLRTECSKKHLKMTIFRSGDIKWRMRATFGDCGLNFFSCANSSSITLTAGEMGFALAFLGSEKWVVKNVPKNSVLGTLRYRQIGRRGLNRKTVMIDRFLVSNYPSVQIFSGKYDKMSQGTLWVFFVPTFFYTFFVHISPWQRYLYHQS